MAVPGKRVSTDFSKSISLGSEEDLKLFCLPCDRVGPRVVAIGFCQDCNEHLCCSCYDHHQRATPSRHHVLLDKDEMPKIQHHFSTASPGVSATHDDHTGDDDLTIPCTKHKKKMIEFYCRYHKVTICSVCVTLQHNGGSCKVDYIPDISGQAVDSHELKEIVQNIDTLDQNCMELKAKYQEQTENSIRSLTEALTEITNYRQEVNEKIDKLQSKIENKVKTLKQEKTQSLLSIEAICDDVSESLNLLSNNIKQKNKPSQANKLFIELQAANEELKQHETCIKQVSNDDVETFHFQPNTEIIAFLQTQTFFGKLEGKLEEQRTQSTEKQTKEQPKYPTPMVENKPDSMSPQAVEHGAPNFKLQRKEQPKLTMPMGKDIPDSNFSPEVEMKEEFTLESTICVRTAEDNRGSYCRISGLALLTPDLLVIADHFNNCMKLICVRSESVTSQLALNSPPHDVTVVTNTQVAVCQPSGQTIQFISVRFGKLTKDNSIHVNGACHGVCHFKDKLVVTYDAPPKFEILDMSGTVLTQVTHNAKDDLFFNKPHYVVADECSIYISDWHNHTVFKFNWQGKERGQLKNFGQNKGLAITSSGILYVCDSTRHKINRLWGDHTVGKIQTSKLNCPSAVDWCTDSKTLFVSSGSYSETGNNIFIFQKM